MKKLKKTFVMLLVMVVVALRVAGCGNKSEQTPSEQPSQEHPSSEHPSGEHPK